MYLLGKRKFETQQPQFLTSKVEGKKGQQASKCKKIILKNIGKITKMEKIWH